MEERKTTYRHRKTEDWRGEWRGGGENERVFRRSLGFSFTVSVEEVPCRIECWLAWGRGKKLRWTGPDRPN